MLLVAMLLTTPLAITLPDMPPPCCRLCHCCRARCHDITCADMMPLRLLPLRRCYAAAITYQTCRCRCLLPFYAITRHMPCFRVCCRHALRLRRHEFAAKYAASFVSPPPLFLCAMAPLFRAQLYAELAPRVAAIECRR